MNAGDLRPPAQTLRAGGCSCAWKWILIIVVGLLIAAGWWLLRTGFSALGHPSALEMFLAQRARNIATPGEAKSARNPFQTTPSLLAEARDHFADHCALCHGYDGKGSTLGQHVYPPAPDLTEAATQDLSDGQIFYIISDGVRFTGMPAWRDQDSSDAIWKLVTFIRYLPHISPADIQQMKKAHPEATEDHAQEHHH